MYVTRGSSSIFYSIKTVVYFINMVIQFKVNGLVPFVICIIYFLWEKHSHRLIIQQIYKMKIINNYAYIS